VKILILKKYKQLFVNGIFKIKTVKLLH